MKKTFISMVLVCLSVFLFNNHSGEANSADDVLKIYLGETKTISVSNPTRIAIANPNLADVANVSKREITLVPKAAGRTTLVVWDNFGEQTYDLKVFTENMDIVKERIDNILKKLDFTDINTKPGDDEGKVFLLGSAKSTQDKERIMVSLGSLKDKTVDLISIKEEEAVIEIDVQILEINKGSTDDLGFTWPGSITFQEVGSAALTPGGTTWGKIFHVADVRRPDAFTLKLDALIQEGKVRVLSRPRLACQSGKEAKLLVGGEVPILSSTVTGGGAQGTTATPGNVEYKEYGIILNIKPVVFDDERIRINLNVEVSEVGDKVETLYALAYPLVKRNASTELFLDNGQTMAIGGLIKQKTQEDLRKVPWLADVPVLGMFFRKKTTTGGGGHDKLTDSELFITLTPRIVSTGKEVKKLKEGTKISQNVKETVSGPIQKYSRLVQGKILDNLKYPPTAKGAAFQGTTKIALNVSYKGELLALRIKESSGYKLLDDNALSTARSISPYPPFPPSIEAEDLWIEIPVSYRLE